MGQYPFRRLQADLAKLISSLPAESRLPSEPDLAQKDGSFARHAARGHAFI